MTASTDLVEMAMSYTRSRVLCAAARLGVADAMAGDERAVQEIAQACGADASALHRLLRALVSLGVTTETGPGRFVLTPAGQSLRRNVYGSAWASVIFWSDLLADEWSYLIDCVRTGQMASQVRETQGAASRWDGGPEAPAIFRAIMGSGPAEDCMPIVTSWDFTRREASIIEAVPLTGNH